MPRFAPVIKMSCFDVHNISFRIIVSYIAITHRSAGRIRPPAKDFSSTPLRLLEAALRAAPSRAQLGGMRVPTHKRAIPSAETRYEPVRISLDFGEANARAPSGGVE